MSAPVELHMDMITSTSQGCFEKMTSEWFHSHLAVQQVWYEFHVNLSRCPMLSVIDNNSAVCLATLANEPCLKMLLAKHKMLCNSCIRGIWLQDVWSILNWVHTTIKYHGSVICFGHIDMTKFWSNTHTHTHNFFAKKNISRPCLFKRIISSSIRMCSLGTAMSAKRSETDPITKAQSWIMLLTTKRWGTWTSRNGLACRTQ